MLNKKLKIVTVLLLSGVLLGGCESSSGTLSSEDIELKDKLFTSTNNYNGLIDLYRQALKNNTINGRSENPEYRFRLAEAYYDVGDYQAAVLYLQPLLKNSDYVQKALLLQMNALSNAGQFKKSLIVADRIIKRYPNLAEGYNGQGIAYANLGQLNNAKKSFEKARSLFINDVTVLNNLAMLYIMQKNYQATVKLLFPPYAGGEKDPRLLHNLVLALVKTNQFEYARQIIEVEGMADNPNALIKSLLESSNQMVLIKPSARKKLPTRSSAKPKAKK